MKWSLNKELIGHVGFWIGVILALLGTFEQALQAGNDPIWSGVYGFPIPHHYLQGLILVVVAYLILYREAVIEVSKSAWKELTTVY